LGQLKPFAPVHIPLRLEEKNEKGEIDSVAQYWKEKIVESGDVIEDILYLHSTDRTQADEKYLENLNRRIRDLTRLLNCNFTERDYLVTLTYSRHGYAKLRADKPPKVPATTYVYKQAKKELSKLLELCRYRCATEGVAFQCIYVTANMNPDTKNRARIHHHLVVSHDAMEILKSLWKHGHVLVEHVYDEVDHDFLARYLMNQVPYEKGRNNFGRTLNLKKPIVTERVPWNPNKVLEPPENATVIKQGRNYLRYTLNKP